MLFHSCGGLCSPGHWVIFPVDEFAASVHQEQLVAAQNTTEISIPSSTSTSSDRREELANMLDSCIEQLSQTDDGA